MIILGAGISGLLAARCLAHHTPKILDIQNDLPNNHSALLRFRSNIIGQSVGIPFKSVQVYKGVLNEQGNITNSPTIRDYNAYSLKTTGNAIARSIININNANRFIAPDTFIRLLASGSSIEYGIPAEDYFRNHDKNKPVISTIPMPSLMSILKYKDIPKFKQIPIWTINCELLAVDVYQTLYIPYDVKEPYRVSITGNKLTMEFMFEPKNTDVIEYYLDLLFPEHIIIPVNSVIKRQNYGKIVPISESERQKFILWATTNFNVYSLGRFATWRQILLDDVIHDIQIINRFINSGDYHRAMHYTQER